jgi:hypothetical protein
LQLQGERDEGALYAGLVARVADELDLYEALPQLLEQQQQQDARAATAAAAAGSAAWMQLVQGWQPPHASLTASGSFSTGGADSSGRGTGGVHQAAGSGACGIRLVCRDGMLPQQLLQEVDTSMHKTASRLVAAAKVAA